MYGYNAKWSKDYKSNDIQVNIRVTLFAWNRILFSWR